MNRTNLILITMAVTSGLYGVGFFLISIRRATRYRNWRDLLLQNPSRIGGFLVGTSLILTSVIVAEISTFWADLLTSFVLVTGVQMALGAAGIRLEFLSNNPTR